MTVSYANEVATTNWFAFIKLLLRWHGSVYKLLWKDLLVFLVAFYALHVMYIFLDEEGKRMFEKIVAYSSQYGNFVPLSFIIGFFVSNIMSRWWSQYMTIPSITGIAVYVSSTLHGYDELGRAMRRTIMRYVCLCLTMALRVLSPRVQKRFPRTSDLVTAGLLHENELRILEDLELKFPGLNKSFLPIVWGAAIASKARKEGRIRDDFAVKTIIEELNKFRGSCGTLLSYNSVTIPLVYTQVVTIAVYMYFLTSLMAEQYVESDSKATFIDFFPILIILQFIFYMGWLKVAETLMNPFGEDDDDFEVNSMIDRNLQMAYLIVDDMHNDHPELLKDQYWNGVPQELPDLGREDGKEKVTFSDDFADYEVTNRSSIYRRRSTRISMISKHRFSEEENLDDVEKGNSDEKIIQPSRISTIFRPDLSPGSNLVPRSSVISGRFKNDVEALKDQAILEMQMEEIRLKDEEIRVKVAQAAAARDVEVSRSEEAQKRDSRAEANELSKQKRKTT